MFVAEALVDTQYSVTIIFLPCGFFLSSIYLSFSPRLITVATDWMSTILLQGVALV